MHCNYPNIFVWISTIVVKIDRYRFVLYILYFICSMGLWKYIYFHIVFISSKYIWLMLIICVANDWYSTLYNFVAFQYMFYTLLLIEFENQIFDFSNVMRNWCKIVIPDIQMTLVIEVDVIGRLYFDNSTIYWLFVSFIFFFRVAKKNDLLNFNKFVGYG